MTQPHAVDYEFKLKAYTDPRRSHQADYVGGFPHTVIRNTKKIQIRRVSGLLNDMIPNKSAIPNT